MRNNARGIGFGLTTEPGGRTYPDNPCPAASGYVDDFGGVIRNNFVYANSSGLFASEYGFDCGICAWNSCNARILHNTVYSTDPAQHLLVHRVALSQHHGDAHQQPGQRSTA